MIELIKKQRIKTPKLCEIMRFLIVGGTATIIDMVVMGALIYILNKNAYSNNFLNVFTSNIHVNDFHIILATSIGFVVGLIFNYIFSIIYVYDYESQQAKTKKGFLLFGILSVIGLIIQTAGMFVLYSLLGINEWISKILLVLVVLSFNYFTRKIFVFKNDPKVALPVQQNECITKKELISNILFIISSMSLCLFLYNPNTFGIDFNGLKYLKYIYAILSGLVVAFYLFFINKKALNSIECKNNSTSIISIIYTITIFSTYLYYGVKTRLYIPISLISVYSIYCYSYLIVKFTIQFIKNFIDEMNDFQKKIFKYIAISLCSYCTITFFITKIFTFPGNMYDALLSFDTGNLVYNNYQINQLYLENDFRHFLMSLFIMPFTILPTMVQNYAVKSFLISIIEILIVSYSAIKLIQFLKIENKQSAIIFSIFYLTTATILINALTVEKFIFALFYIIATVDYSLKKSPLKWLFYIGSIGILTTNIFLLPIVIFTEKKKFSDWISELIVAAMLFCVILLLSGQFNLLLFFKESWESLKRFSSLNGDTTIYQNFIQYLSFNSSMIIMPQLTYTNTISQALPSIGSCIFGAVILIISTISFILNYRDKLAQIAFYWQLFMILLLVLLGWGSALNEMFIYSSLFLWSTIILIIKFIEYFFKTTKSKNIVLIASCLLFITTNLPILIKILIFGFVNY